MKLKKHVYFLVVGSLFAGSLFLKNSLNRSFKVDDSEASKIKGAWVLSSCTGSSACPQCEAGTVDKYTGAVIVEGVDGCQGTSYKKCEWSVEWFCDTLNDTQACGFKEKPWLIETHIYDPTGRKIKVFYTECVAGEFEYCSSKDCI